jgi:integrase
LDRKTDTAKKLKQRLSYIMKWAKAQAYYTGDNPVELAEQALPRLKASESHFKALPYTEIHNIIAALQSLEIQTSTKLSLQFLILTASRQKEVLNARWDEIDFNLNKWVVPANRMKAGKEHEVPLSKQALKILQDAKLNDGDSPLLFPSSTTGKPLSDNTLRLVLQKRLQLDTTTHGLRSSFKDWASETTHYPNEVSEMALAHSIPNAVEAAYRRGNLFEKRRQLMNDWAAYLYSQQSEVIQLVRGSTA